jgi:hypothetical protein
MSWFQNVVRQFEPVLRHVSDLVSTRVSAHFGFPPESATAATELLMRAHAGDEQAREKISRLARNPKMRGYLLEIARHLREHPNYGAFRAHAEQRPVEPPPPPPVQEVAPPPPPDERRHHHHHHGEHPWAAPQGPVPPPYDPHYGWPHAHSPAFCDAWGCHGHGHGHGQGPEAWRRHPHDGWHGHDPAAAQLYGEPPPWAFGPHPHAPFFGGMGPMHGYGWHEPARYGLPMPAPGAPHPWGYGHAPLALPPSYPHDFAPGPNPYAPFYPQRDVPYAHGWPPPHPGAYAARPPPPMRGPAPPVPTSPIPPGAQEHVTMPRATGLTSHSTWSAGTPEVGRAQVVSGEEATGADRPYAGHVPHPHFHHRPGFGAEPFGTEWLLEEQQALERLVTPDDGEPEAWRVARAPAGTPGI